MCTGLFHLVVCVSRKPNITPRSERLDCHLVHVNSIIPNNLRICPVVDKHGGQLSGKKKRETEVKMKEKKGCRCLLRQSTIKILGKRDGGGRATVVHLITFVPPPLNLQVQTFPFTDALGGFYDP